MNPSTRRYLPIVGVVALLLVAVYFGKAPITGSATGAGCAGGEGQLATENDLGTVEGDAMDSVNAVATFDRSIDGETESIEDLKSTVEDLGAIALPALFENLGSDGFCMQAGATDVLDLIQVIGNQENFDNQVSDEFPGGLLTIVADKLIKVAVYALDDASAGPDTEMQEASHPVGGDKPPRGMQASEAGQQRRFDCAEKAFDVVQGMAASDQADLDTVLNKTIENLDALPDADIAAMELLNLLAELAPEDEEWAKIFERYAVSVVLHKDAQGAACEAAVERGSVLSMLREDLGSVTSPSVSVCVVDASVSWEETDYAEWGLKNSEERVRLAAIAAYGSLGDGDDVAVLLSHLFSQADPNGVSATESERNVTITVIASLVKDAESETTELLTGALELADKLGAEGADWLSLLDQAIPDWEQADSAK